MKRSPMRRRVSRDPVPPEERMRVEHRSGGRCEVEHFGSRCTDRAVQVHHVLRRAQGGSHDARNLLHVCVWCHEHIHRNPAWSYERGYLRRSSSVRLLPEDAA